MAANVGAITHHKTWHMLTCDWRIWLPLSDITRMRRDQRPEKERQYCHAVAAQVQEPGSSGDAMGHMSKAAAVTAHQVRCIITQVEMRASLNVQPEQLPGPSGEEDYAWREDWDFQRITIRGDNRIPRSPSGTVSTDIHQDRPLRRELLLICLLN